MGDEMIPGTWLGNGKCKRSPYDPDFGLGPFARAGEPVSMPADVARRKWAMSRWAPSDPALVQAWGAEDAERAQATAEAAVGLRRDAVKGQILSAVRNDPTFAAELRALLGDTDGEGKGKGKGRKAGSADDA